MTPRRGLLASSVAALAIGIAFVAVLWTVDLRSTAKSVVDAEGFAVGWVAVNGAPQLVGGPCLSWRCAGVGDPALAATGDGQLHLWFTTMGIRETGPQKFAADGPWFGHAVAADRHALKFRVEPEHPVLVNNVDGSWNHNIETPSVLLDPDSSHWRMWYVGWKARGGVSGLDGTSIGQLRSTDLSGLEWQGLQEPPIYRPEKGAWDEHLVSGPAAVAPFDGTWRIYFCGVGSKRGIGLLTSSDGMHWTPYSGNPVIEADPTGWDQQMLELSVVHTRGQFWMWYSGYRDPLDNGTAIAIGLATSPDGIHWTRHPRNPVLKPGEAGSWNDLRVLAPEVLVEPDGSLLMAAYGQSRKDPGKSAGSIGFWRSK